MTGEVALDPRLGASWGVGSAVIGSSSLAPGACRAAFPWGRAGVRAPITPPRTPPASRSGALAFSAPTCACLAFAGLGELSGHCSRPRY